MASSQGPDPWYFLFTFIKDEFYEEVLAKTCKLFLEDGRCFNWKSIYQTIIYNDNDKIGDLSAKTLETRCVGVRILGIPDD